METLDGCIFGYSELGNLFLNASMIRFTCKRFPIGRKEIRQRLEIGISRSSTSQGDCKHAARASIGLRFLAVLGVLPRNLPGVLKISVTFLIFVSIYLVSAKTSYIHLIFAEDVGHMLVQPFHLIASRESKVL